MREIVLDTETTGLDPNAGHKLVEIGCLELINHVPTGEKLHLYINPEREMDPGAFEIHGLSTEFLSKHRPFRDHADEILSFLADSTLIIHNASFDMKFLNFELEACDRRPLPMSQALDTVRLARRKYPGAQVSLDALCRRFEINNEHRTLHGALLDSELLAEVYLELIGGRQPGLEMGGPGGAVDTERSAAEEAAVAGSRAQGIRPPRPQAASPEELAAHAAFLDKLKEPIWNS